MYDFGLLIWRKCISFCSYWCSLILAITATMSRPSKSCSSVGRWKCGWAVTMYVLIVCDCVKKNVVVILADKYGYVTFRFDKFWGPRQVVALYWAHRSSARIKNNDMIVCVDILCVLLISFVFNLDNLISTMLSQQYVISTCNLDNVNNVISTKVLLHLKYTSSSHLYTHR